MEIKLSNAEEKLKEIKDTDLTQLDDFALLSMKMQMPERSERDGLRGTTQGGDVYQLK